MLRAPDPLPARRKGAWHLAKTRVRAPLQWRGIQGEDGRVQAPQPKTVPRGPVLPQRLARSASQKVQSSAESAPAAEPKKIFGVEQLTVTKIAGLGAIFFLILYSYTILRDSKVRQAVTY